MPEPSEQLIAAALVTRLQAIVADGGTTAWYTPTKVYRCGRKWDPSIIDASLGTPAAPAVVYAVRTAPPRYFEFETDGGVRGEMETYVLMARQDYRPTDDPEREETPIAATIAARMFRDVVRAMFRSASGGVDSALGQVGGCANVTTDEGIGGEDWELKKGGWIVRVLTTTVQFLARGSVL